MKIHVFANGAYLGTLHDTSLAALRSAVRIVRVYGEEPNNLTVDVEPR
jgi:hypothetical protein